jgi:hypothetical protein
MKNTKEKGRRAREEKKKVRIQLEKVTRFRTNIEKKSSMSEIFFLKYVFPPSLKKHIEIVRNWPVELSSYL